MGREFIYARVSTDGQSTDSQLQQLQLRYPTAQVVNEIASGTKGRPLLRTLLENLNSGDVLIVFALDRLGRRTSEVLTLVEDLDRRGVQLVSVREGVDYGTISGRLILQILASVAEMERNMIAERTKAGLAAARAKGRVGGRPRRFKEEDFERGRGLVAGGASFSEASRCVGMSATWLRRNLKGRESEQKLVTDGLNGER